MMQVRESLSSLAIVPSREWDVIGPKQFRSSVMFNDMVIDIRLQLVISGEMCVAFGRERETESSTTNAMPRLSRCHVTGSILVRQAGVNFWRNVATRRSPTFKWRDLVAIAHICAWSQASSADLSISFSCQASRSRLPYFPSIWISPHTCNSNLSPLRRYLDLARKSFSAMICSLRSPFVIVTRFVLISFCEAQPPRFVTSSHTSDGLC